MSNKKLLVKVYFPEEAGPVSTADIDKVLDRIHKNERVIDYNCTLSCPSIPTIKSSSGICYSKTVPSNSDVPTPSIVVDVFVNTGEDPAQIKEILDVVYESVNQTLVVEKNLQGEIGIEVIDYSPTS